MSKIEILLEGDCLELMKEIPDGSIDMILADLPYGITKNKLDVIIPFEPLWEQYERIIKDNGAIVLYSQGLFYIDLVNSNRKYFKYDWIWDKQLTSGFLNANRMPLRVHEQVAVFYKKQPTYNPQKIIGEKSHSKGRMLTDKNNNYNKYNKVDNTNKLGELKHPKSIISFQKPHPSKALHRTEKSVECNEYFIKTYTNEGDLILDNVAGSGSTGEAARNTNRNFILIEKNPEDCKTIRKRLNLD